MIAIVTDSNAQLPPELLDRHDIEVVPLVIQVDGVEYREGVDLDVDWFYDRLAEGAEVTTSQPSPGEVLAVYERAVGRGVEAIVSVHLSGELSGTVNSARLAAEMSSVPVTVVDSGQTSFSLGCCVLRAAELGALASAARVEHITASIDDLSPTIHNVFVMGGLELAAASGRVEISATVREASSDGVPVMSFREGELTVLGSHHDIDGAVEHMCSAILSTPGPLRVGIGVADRQTFGFYDAFRARLAEEPSIRELIDYRCGPTVGAYTGPGTAGACWHQLPE